MNFCKLSYCILIFRDFSVCFSWHNSMQFSYVSLGIQEVQEGSLVSLCIESKKIYRNPNWDSASLQLSQLVQFIIETTKRISMKFRFVVKFNIKCVYKYDSRSFQLNITHNLHEVRNEIRFCVVQTMVYITQNYWIFFLLVHLPLFFKKRTRSFGNCICFCLQMRGRRLLFSFPQKRLSSITGQLMSLQLSKYEYLRPGFVEGWW
jgi:hypothetical protein